MAYTYIQTNYSDLTITNNGSYNQALISYSTLDYDTTAGDTIEVYNGTTKLDIGTSGGTNGYHLDTSSNKNVVLHTGNFTGSGNVISVYRKAKLTGLEVDFSNASVLTEEDLDGSAKQIFHVAQEAIDTANTSITADADGTFNVNNKRLKNVSTPTQDSDAATKSYADGGASGQAILANTSSISKIGTGYDGTDSTSGSNTNLTQINSVATNLTNINNVANDAVDIGKVAGKEAEIGRLGATAYTDGANAYLAKLGVDSMSNATTGNIKKVADVATEVGVVAESTYKGKVETVADSTYKGKVETVADSTYKGKVETVADSTYKGKVETVADSTYKGKVETVADSTYKGKVETVAGSTYKTKVEAVADAVTNVNNFANTYHTPSASSSAPSSNVTEGDLWFQTDTNKLKVYDGSSWVDSEAVIGSNSVTSSSGNLTLSGASTSNNVVINSDTSSSGNSITLPKVRASTNNYVLAMSDKTTGATEWQATSIAPTITGLSGELNTFFSTTTTGNTQSGADIRKIASICTQKIGNVVGTNLRAGQTITGTGIPSGTTITEITTASADNTSNGVITISADATSVASGTTFTFGGEEDGGTLTVTGTDFGTDASAINSIKIMKSDGTNAVSASSFGTPTGTGIPDIVFNGGEFNYNTFPADTTWYIEVTKSSLPSNRFSSGKSFTKDPTISAITQSVASDDYNSGFTGTSGHFGSYGGQVAGGGLDSNTKVLLNFDRSGGTDFEDSSNTGSDGHKVTASGHASIKSSPFGDGKSAIYFDAVDGTEVKVTSFNTGTGLGAGAFTLEAWIWCEDHNPDSANPIIIDTRTGSNGFGIEMVKTSGQLFIWDSVANSEIITNTASTFLPLQTWTHLAVVRAGAGTPVKLYLDGKEAGSSSNNSSDYDSETLTFGRAYNANASNFKGYQDEIRVCVGTAVYTGDFTVPTSRLSATQISGTNISAITGEQTKLLIHSNQQDDSSNNNHTLTYSGIVFKHDVSKFGGGSIYWDGSNDYVHVPISAIGTGVFTFDFWIRPDSQSSSASEQNILDIRGYDGSSFGNGFVMQWTKNSDKLKIYDSVASGYLGTPSIAINKTGDWTHIAFERYDDSGTKKLKLYINGVQDTGFSSGAGLASTSNYSSTRITIGNGSDAGSSNVIEGHIDEFRLSTVARYNGTAFGSSLESSAYSSDANTELLIHADTASFVDSSPTTNGRSVHAITRTGAIHSKLHGGIAPAMVWPSSLKKTGSSGVYFDGDGDYLTTELNPVIGTGQFTFDFWMYALSSSNGLGTLIDTRNTSNLHGMTIQIPTSLRLQCYASGGTAASAWNFTTPDQANGKITLNTWHHIAFERNSSDKVQIYIDGIGHEVDASDSTDFTEATLNIGIQMDRGATSSFEGYIDSFRYSNTARFNTTNFSASLPTRIYGAYGPENPSIGSIEITTATDVDENVTYSFQGSTEDNASVLGSSSDLAIASDTTGANKKKGTLTGTLQGNAGSVTNLRIQAKANNDAKRLVEVNENSGVGAVSFTKVGSGKPVLFNARRYVGNDTVRDLNGFGFQPDLCWFKERNSSNNHQLMDSIRGGSEIIYSNHNYSKADRSGNHGFVKSFNPDGITLSSDTDDHGINRTGEPTIIWGWKAGNSVASIGSGLTNCSAVTQSASSTSGFSITKYTGGASGAIAFPHNLGGTPEFIIIKKTSGSGSWLTYHKDLGAGYNIFLDTDAERTPTTDNGYYGTQTSTNIVLEPKASNNNNDAFGNGIFICYAWKPVAGVSAFGTYTDNGSEPRTITTGFAPRLLIIKATDGVDHWMAYDAFREKAGTRNNTHQLRVNDSASESTVSATTLGVTLKIDDGFILNGGHNAIHGDNNTYIYMAFA